MHRQDFQSGVLGDGYDVVVCNACGAGFADGIPTQEELNRYYAEQSKYSYDGSGGAESVFDIRRFELTVNQVVPHLRNKEMRILDIGCATGGLLSVLKKRGYNNVLGADPSPTCAEAARRLHDVEVRAATLTQLAGWGERFDLILMLGVLEHLRDVGPAVQVVTSLLKPGGQFYAAVPDVEGLADSRNAPFTQFSMEHVNFFSCQSLTGLLAGNGMAPVQTWQEVVEWREGVTEPILAGLFKVGGGRLEAGGGEALPQSSVLSPNQSGTINPSSVIRPQSSVTSSMSSGAHPPSTVLQPPTSRLLPPSDLVTGPSLERYITVSHAGDEAIRAKIDRLVASREPLLVWGAGALTRRLLASTRLAEANIIAFVDSNTHFQGTQLAGRNILSPTQLAARPEAILICSVAFEREITRTIQETLKLPNRLITLQ